MNKKCVLLWVLVFACKFCIGKNPVYQDDIYLKWTTAQFGKKAAALAKAIFSKSAGTPVYPYWQSIVKSSSPLILVKSRGIIPDTRPWTEVEKQYSFIIDFENLKPLITGSAAVQRYQYWHHVFYYFRSRAKTACLIGEMNQFAQQSAQQTDQVGNKIRLASLTLDRRNQAAEEWQQMIRYRQACLKTNPQKESVAIKKDDRATLNLLTLHDGLIKDVLGQTAPALNFPNE